MNIDILQVLKLYFNWAKSWENLFMPYVNNKAVEQIRKYLRIIQG